MKTNFFIRAFIALAVAGIGAVSFQGRAGETTISTQANGTTLPTDIQPGTPTAEVLKLVQAGVDASVIKTYISNCPSAFNLDANKIISLSDAGLPGDVINDMIAHDKNYLASMSTEPVAPTTESTSEPAAPVANSSEAQPVSEPPTEVNVNYFYDNLAPYGAWVDIEGYGRCWRPNVTLYDATWRPYCDRGHWVYTDCGWYWNSDYSWGITFHYGRWFNSPGYGWCWWPDTVWAPSWVTWRSSSTYYGWAPLPPLTAYQPGVGFLYHGKSVAIGFNFGLAASCYTFVAPSHFCDPRPRTYCVPPQQVNQFYNQTVVINNFNNSNHRMINNGVSVTVIGQAAHRPIQPVAVNSLGNPGHRYYQTANTSHPANHPVANAEAQHGANHPANPSRPENGNIHQPSHPATVPNNSGGSHPSHQIYTPNRLHSPHDTPQFTRPVPSAPATQNQPRNNWSFSGSQYHQATRPSSSSASHIGQIPNNGNMVRNETHFSNRESSRPAYRAPVVIGQNSPRSNPTPHAPSISQSRQSSQPIGGGQRNWLSKNH